MGKADRTTIYNNVWKSNKGDFEVTVKLDATKLASLINRASSAHSLETIVGHGALIVQVTLPPGVERPAKKRQYSP